MSDEGVEVLSQALPQRRRTSLILAGLEQPDNGMADSAGQRVATERRPVVARTNHFHHRARRDQSRYGDDPTAEGVVPDMYILGKALGGGIVPVSALVSSRAVMEVIRPGNHGSTFGGNPLACAIGHAVVGLLETGEYQARAAALGERLRQNLDALVGHGVLAVRSRGLWAGVDVDPDLMTGREVCA